METVNSPTAKAVALPDWPVSQAEHGAASQGEADPEPDHDSDEDDEDQAAGFGPVAELERSSEKKKDKAPAAGLDKGGRDGRGASKYEGGPDSDDDDEDQAAGFGPVEPERSSARKKKDKAPAVVFGRVYKGGPGGRRASKYEGEDEDSKKQRVQAYRREYRLKRKKLLEELGSEAAVKEELKRRRTEAKLAKAEESKEEDANTTATEEKGNRVKGPPMQVRRVRISKMVGKAAWDSHQERMSGGSQGGLSRRGEEEGHDSEVAERSKSGTDCTEHGTLSDDVLKYDLLRKDPSWLGFFETLKKHKAVSLTGPIGARQWINPNRNAHSDLHLWVNAQRTMYSFYHTKIPARPTNELGKSIRAKIAKLNTIGFVWNWAVEPPDDADEQWALKFKELRGYVSTRGDCAVPTYTELGTWCNHQRIRFEAGDLSKDKVLTLDALGFPWEQPKESDWSGMFVKLTAFHSKHGDCLVPSVSYEEEEGEEEGVEVSEDERLLRIWCQRQRTEHEHFVQNEQERMSGKPPNYRFYQNVESMLTQDKIDALNGLGFVWFKQAGYRWIHKYRQLKAFKAKHGHCRVPARRKGSKQEVGLAKFVYFMKERRRRTKNPLDPLKVKLLDDIGFEWGQTDNRHVVGVEQRMKWLREFREECGHCVVPQNHPTLGEFVKRMRREYVRRKNGQKTSQLSDERLAELEELGFVWVVKKRRHPGRRPNRNVHGQGFAPVKTEQVAVDDKQSDGDDDALNDHQEGEESDYQEDPDEEVALDSEAATTAALLVNRGNITIPAGITEAPGPAVSAMTRERKRASSSQSKAKGTTLSANTEGGRRLQKDQDFSDPSTVVQPQHTTHPSGEEQYESYEQKHSGHNTSWEQEPKPNRVQHQDSVQRHAAAAESVNYAMQMDSTTATSGLGSHRVVHPPRPSPSRLRMAEEMKCGLCSGIMVQSTGCIPCGHSFCKGCVEHVFAATGRTCPTCATFITDTVWHRHMDSIILCAVESRDGFTELEMEVFLRRSGMKSQASALHGHGHSAIQQAQATDWHQGDHRFLHGGSSLV